MAAEKKAKPSKRLTDAYVMQQKIRKVVEDFRSHERQHAKFVHVHAYDRPSYRIKDPKIRRLVRWRELERKILSLCMDVVDGKRYQHDAEFAERAVKLLSGMFKG